MVAVVGELRNGSYTDKDGNKRYTTDVIVTEQYFAESKSSYEGRSQGGYSQAPQNNGDFAPAQQPYQQAPAQPQYQQAPQQAPQAQPDGFMPIDTDIEGDEDLPF